MSSKLVAVASTIITPTVTIAYIDTYWHRGYTERYLSIGRQIINYPPIKTILDEIHAPITPPTK